MRYIKICLFIFTICLFKGVVAQNSRSNQFSFEVGINKGIGKERHNLGSFAVNWDLMLTRSAMVGVGTCLSITDGTYERYIVPVYGRLKFHFTDSKISPFFLMNIGYTFGTRSKPGEAFGVMFSPYLGVDFNTLKERGLYLMLGVVYQGHELFKEHIINSKSINRFLWGPELKIGFRF